MYPKTYTEHNQSLEVIEIRNPYTCNKSGQHKLIPTPAVLRALADRIIPGLPPSLRVAILQQTSTDAENPSPAMNGPSTSAPEDTTVLQHVIEGDQSRTALIQDLQGLPPPPIPGN